MAVLILGVLRQRCLSRPNQQQLYRLLKEMLGGPKHLVRGVGLASSGSKGHTGVPTLREVRRPSHG
jgi:hypothetical protein